MNESEPRAEHTEPALKAVLPLLDFDGLNGAFAVQRFAGEEPRRRPSELIL
ncbi:MAG: hypothetical protein JSS45_12675 [Proteobacteria bacterium]|nr:hypothetical protein [Pseudomonadota bacterium]